jgi:hypothetical protein
MLKCDTGYLRNSCRWHPPWTKNCDLCAPARKIFSAGLPPRTPPGMNSHLSTVVHTWKTHRIWATCLGDPGPLADAHGAPRDPPCGGLPNPELIIKAHSMVEQPLNKQVEQRYPTSATARRRSPPAPRLPSPSTNTGHVHRSAGVGQ